MDQIVFSVDAINQYLTGKKDLVGVYSSFITTTVAVFSLIVAYLVYRSAKRWLHDYFDKSKLAAVVSIRSDLFKIKSLRSEVKGCKLVSCQIINITSEQLSAVQYAKSHTLLNEQKNIVFGYFSPAMKMLLELRSDFRKILESMNNAMLSIKDAAVDSTDYLALVKGVEDVSASLNKINENISEALVEFMTAQSNVLTYGNEGKSITIIKNQNNTNANNLNGKLNEVAAIYDKSLSEDIDKILSIKMIHIV